ncbi:2-amino-4-hydroxy-6-hydroxymethyldihydropteridine diphosphokinase [Stutzerimonas kirkiae]|uniref:2-amino-4-hydroxy-6-hydroxymethyldihydropteridine diphosphokinase n=1 Tax=Stutzerimonas kirkiae TaxID=2211392 RepID=A0A4Q9R1I8_9GAMM|nr:2-amino-4-hydroxy-6-hydroxymethyldihydropteridine diphosphokinase [Stutzerimonas kirkiae]TBU92010.1 2-amino-4-hydroxy-6-hydroxymethyldihydropteridine diphosphokinase [Stutzerimonas kirkiae]TBU99439.1 2-amino-4-hydroxy-6-hydroxymethyldihydropteridine diphosphokinase [Stutzerimonas kirkiae]TBV05571.1 2-amino-4-hydroxy-6-hydroxymethyldihydropteridine diphosphokinase [Stutzerimonas kirkiae]TBV10690.1 2-amino-4-hydroxy-6-hydroxymethyldihydropteridine diphosphokinase [Stutzerimonas kirkiae]
MSLTPVLLGLGSNAEREKHLTAGLDALSSLLVDMRCSPVFESLAVGYKGDNFYNLVVIGHCESELMELDRRLKFIEADNGRYAPDRKGLPLDIDVLTFGDLHGDFNGLVLPRAEILRNAFVLWPLALLAPEVPHPGDGRTFAELWQAARIEQSLWPVPFRWRGGELTPVELLGECPE